MSIQTESGFSFGSHHSGPFTDSSKSFAEVGASTNKGNLKVVFVDVEFVVSRGENFTFIDEVNFKGFENSSFSDVANAAFGHYWDGNCFLDGLNQSGV